MTNAEAIEEIKSRISTTEYVGGSYVDCVDLEALKLAIKALEAQERLANNSPELANNFGDLISRKAAIEALMEFDKKLRKINWYQYPYIEHECRGVDKAIVKIASLPSAQPDLSGYSDKLWRNAYERGKAEAQPERKKGKWIKHIDDLFPAESTLECNVCHHEQPLTIDDNFCPNCGSYNGGARMEGD